MLINVTQKHIDNGTRRSYCDCPIALALKESIPEYNWIVQAVGIATYYLEGRLHQVHLSDECRRFVKELDENKTVLPFSFELELE